MLNEFAGNRKVSGEAIGRDETLHHTSHEILINYLFTDLFIYLLFLFIYLFIYYLHNNKNTCGSLSISSSRGGRKLPLWSV